MAQNVLSSKGNCAGLFDNGKDGKKRFNKTKNIFLIISED